jgi:hypothetical protein
LKSVHKIRTQIISDLCSYLDFNYSLKKNEYKYGSGQKTIHRLNFIKPICLITDLMEPYPSINACNVEYIPIILHKINKKIDLTSREFTSFRFDRVYLANIIKTL